MLVPPEGRADRNVAMVRRGLRDRRTRHDAGGFCRSGPRAVNGNLGTFEETPVKTTDLKHDGPRARPGLHVDNVF